MTDLARDDHVSFDVTDADGFSVIFVVAGFASTGEVEVIYDGEDFAGRYSGSLQTTITDGFTFNVARTDGWHAAPIIAITAVDAFGNLTRESISYGLAGAPAAATNPLQAIAKRVAEVCEGAGAVRLVEAGRLAPLATQFEGNNEAALKALQALTTERYQVEAHWLGRNDSTTPIMGNVELADVAVVVRTWHPLKHYGRRAVDYQDAKHGMKALAADVRRALEHPGNLETTGAGVATKLIGKRLTWVDSTDPVPSVAPGVLMVEQIFRGRVQDTLATS